MVLRIVNNYAYLLIFIAAFLLRFVNLGYSDFQGDEYKALFLPTENQVLSEYLMDQRKGPMQFLVTYSMKLLDPAYDNRFLVRLPFATAGFLAVIFFYRFLDLYFGKKVASFAAFFFATNGFLIAFSRIVQYQSLVIFFMLSALYLFSLSIFTVRWRISGLYLGFILWSLSILSHYDGIFIAPFVGYIVYRWFEMNSNMAIGKKIKHLVLAICFFIIALLIFYVPFVLTLSDSTLDYWSNRLSGGQGKVSSSIYLFKVYHPIYIIHIYYLLAGLGLFKYVFDFLNTYFSCNKICKGSIINLLSNLKDLFISRFSALMLWFFIPWVFFEVVVNIPGTHIFVYLIPLTVFMAFGITLIGNVIRYLFYRFKLPYWKVLYYFGVAAVFVFIFLQSFYVFVDNRYEYPWENERFLFWEFHKPSSVFHLSMFGFPYYRHMNEVGEYVMQSENNGYYSTNERDSIVRNVIFLDKRIDGAGHFVYVRDPQSFIGYPTQPKAQYWVDNYTPEKVFYKSNCFVGIPFGCKQTEKPIVEIYNMPSGSLKDIKALGY